MATGTNRFLINNKKNAAKEFFAAFFFNSIEQYRIMFVVIST